MAPRVRDEIKRRIRSQSWLGFSEEGMPEHFRADFRAWRNESRTDRSGNENGRRRNDEMRALFRQPPLQPEIALGPRLRILRDDRDQQRTFLDLRPDFVIPRIASDEFALVEPDLDAGGAQRFANALRRLGVLGRIGEKDCFA